ncbi:right-handed parallel beta-helix repeat-containing protein [Paraliomyxa miuraensis]|uniref:right-handed parallel beta-helix repeat-containing protein n=1 Tax=Paraliomyxa miuraensis TaxID=376150 RepID=UPI002256D20B|nr:right-handed parallel beta-helix repeat-containing protein [Paraliomyxa miuraensis]MCX4247581.1 right-handed parallel beta-helix repeat-containing protein [Paraliomyxa miuraensis]
MRPCLLLIVPCALIAIGCGDPPPAGETETEASSGTTLATTTTTTSADDSTTIDPGTTSTGEPDPSSGTTATSGSDSGSSTATDTDTDTDTSDDPDDDADGHPASVDCDDTDPDVHPGAVERCNGIDDDCDATTPEDGVVSVDGQGSHASIFAAVAASVPGSEVRVCAGTFVENVGIPHDLWLVSQEGAAVTTIDGGGAAPTLVVSAGEVVITGFTLTGGQSNGLGGGLSITGTDLVTVEQCTITGNTSSDGAGVYTYVGAQLVLVDTTIADNIGGIGGGLAMNGNGLTGSLTMTGCTVANNVSDELGGGMALFDIPQVTIDSSSIIDNDGLDGAGIGTAGSTITLTDTTVQRNVATGSGGGLLLYAGSGTVTVIDGDWGTGVDDNGPQDVAIPGVGAFGGYGAATGFVCNAMGCG